MGKSTEIESRTDVTREWGEWELGSYYIIGTVSVWNDERALEINGDDACTTLGMYLMPLSINLKMVKMVNFMLYKFLKTL